MSISRSDQILKFIVEYFIKTAQPVGSQTLIDEYHLPYSSATIRNEMMLLEKLGYLEKTHTSSGRVPSSKGYKYYCKNLRDGGVDEALKNSLQIVLNQRVQSIEEVIKASCEILSHMTNLVSVVMGPDENSEKLANVQLIKINDNTLTAVFVTDKGYVENKTFIVPQNMDSQELIDCVKLLNERLTGTPVINLVEKIESIKPILNDYITGHDLIYQALLETFVKFAGDRLSLYGREELFAHPEFKNDSEKLVNVLKMLNNSSVLKEIDEENRQEEDSVVLHIGDIKENPDVSTITAKIKVGNKEENTITLLGPTRMDYDKALSALEYLADELENYFKTGGTNNGGKV